MPAISFKQKFAEAIESGAKTQTIRQVWKRPIEVGDTLYLYSGMRTENCQKLKVVKCTGVETIKISDPLAFTPIKVDGIEISLEEAGALARADGFKDLVSMIDFFKDNYGLPFEGVIIYWGWEAVEWKD